MPTGGHERSDFEVQRIGSLNFPPINPQNPLQWNSTSNNERITANAARKIDHAQLNIITVDNEEITQDFARARGAPVETFTLDGLG